MRSIASRFRGLSVAGALAAGAVALVAPFAANAQAVCHNCGTVESVSTVQRTGQAKGIAGTPVTPGMAIGGVVGGVLGNQVIGGGAATVLGAAGGAVAGHAIEKGRAQYTAYVMRIRMADGTTRTIEQRTALARGAQVVVNGHTAQLRRTSTHDAHPVG